MAFNTISNSSIPINSWPITKEGIQEQNPQLHPKMDCSMENVDFSDIQVKAYANQFFTRQENSMKRQNDAKSFLKTITRDSNLSSISHVPLQLQMLCSMWEQGVRESGFGQSAVRLYQNMVEQLFLWQYQRQGKKTSTLSYSEKEASSEKEALLLSLLGEIGQQGLSIGQLDIPLTIIEKSCSVKNITPKALLDTGLLKAMGEGAEKRYVFLHLTFQEYLIAYSVSRKSLEEQHTFISENRLKPQYRQSLVFLAGITHQSDQSYDKVQAKNFFKSLYGARTNVCVEDQIELVLKCLKGCPDYAGEVSEDLETLIKRNLLENKIELILKCLKGCPDYFGEVSEDLETLIKGNLSILGGELSRIKTPFIFATEEGNIPGMRWLHRMDHTLCSKTDKGGSTPFHLAAVRGHTKAMKLLYSWDPTLCSKTNEHGDTPFHLAAMRGHTEAMKLLYSWDPTLCSKTDTYGSTPFHLATRQGHIKAMKLLYSWDPTLCSKNDKGGNTPFHLATRHGHIKALKLLSLWNATP